MVVLEGFSYGEVAKIEGVARETVVVRISRARAKLTACLKDAPRPFAPREYRVENDNTPNRDGPDADAARQLQ
jgi:hypothetical protein